MGGKLQRKNRIWSWSLPTRNEDCHMFGLLKFYIKKKFDVKLSLRQIIKDFTDKKGTPSRENTKISKPFVRSQYFFSYYWRNNVQLRHVALPPSVTLVHKNKRNFSIGVWLVILVTRLHTKNISAIIHVLFRRSGTIRCKM